MKKVLAYLLTCDIDDNSAVIVDHTSDIHGTQITHGDRKDDKLLVAVRHIFFIIFVTEL